MFFRISFIVLFLVSIIAAACDPCMGTGWACADPFYFRLVDKQTGQDLVYGSNPTYSKDSVYLTVHLTGYLGNMSYADTNKRFMSTLLIPVDTFFLRVSSTDTDTLLMSYSFKKMRCCKGEKGFGTLTGIKFNGRTAPLVNGMYLLEK